MAWAVTTPDRIEIRGAAENNLREVDVDLPHGQLIAITGVSGSGKSSLAFDTIYAEARRRFLLSAEGGAAAFAHRLQPPAVARLDGLRPALAIAQARRHPSSRSTTATLTGMADYLRLLWARVGQARCVVCGAAVTVEKLEEVVERACGYPSGTRLVVLAPLAIPHSPAEAAALLAEVERSGYRRVRSAAETHVLDEITAEQLVGAALEVVVDRVVVKADTRRRLKGSLQAAASVGAGRVVLVDQDRGTEVRSSVRPACATCGAGFPDVSPALFSFNGPLGACPRCRGSGLAPATAFGRLLSLGESPLVALAVLWERFGHRQLCRDIAAFCRRSGVDGEDALSEWSDAAVEALWEGEARRARGKPFVGLRRWLGQRAASTEDDDEAAWLAELEADGDGAVCPDCDGQRLSPAALAVEIDGESIAQFLGRTAAGAAARLQTMAFADEARTLADHILAAVRQALAVLVDLGLGYLTLDRRAPTLSAGEFQRLQLVAALGSGLSQVLYVLDEPSAGLHARDTDRLAAALARLRDDGNTVLVVEHDLSLIRDAELVVELGPGAGADGGHLVFADEPAALRDADTATARALATAVGAATRDRVAGVDGWLRLTGARGHNLRGIDVNIPLGCLVCVSGVSGSGKSSLVHDTLLPCLAGRLQGGERRPLPFDKLEGVEALERVVAVDQAPIGRTSRSNAATYTGLMAALRGLFVELPEARLRGYGPGHFSFNSTGACPGCAGSGLDPAAGVGFEDLPLPCATCGGSRYRREVLEIRFRDHSIADVLELSVGAAADLFANVPEAARRLRLLAELGLGYLRLGQPASCLSGGEAQRVKLAAELGRPLLARSLYILDEPTAGLHRHDIGFLVELLQRLVDRGSTVLVVEHDLGLVAAADYVIDLGPEAGDAGGAVVVAGSPSQVAACEASHTGRCLAAEMRGEVVPR